MRQEERPGRPSRRTEQGTLADGVFWTNRVWWKRAGVTTVVLWLGTGLSFVAAIVAARSLGPRDYGFVVLAVSMVALVAGFLDLTLEEAVVHYGFETLEKRDWGALRSILRTALLIDVAVGLVIFVFLFVAAESIARLTGSGIDPLLVRLAAFAVLAATADGTTGAVLLLAKRPDLRAWVVAGSNFVRLLMVLAAVSFGGPAAVVMAYVASALMGAGIQAFLSWRIIRANWAPVVARPAMRRWAGKIVSFGLHSSFTTSVTSAGESLVPILVGRLAGPSSVGLLGVAMFPISAARVASAPLRMAIYPEQAHLSAQQRRSDLIKSVRGHTLLGLGIGLAAAIPGWFLMPRVLETLYSSAFIGATDPARILMAAGVLTLAFGWTKTLAPALGRPGVRTAVSAVYLLLLVTLVLVLVQPLGLLGAAWALVLSMGLASLSWWVAAARLLRPPDVLAEIDGAQQE